MFLKNFYRDLLDSRVHLALPVLPVLRDRKVNEVSRGTSDKRERKVTLEPAVIVVYS